MGRRIAACVLMALACLMASAAHASYQGTLASVTHRGQLYNANSWDAEVIWYGSFFDQGFRDAYIQRATEVNHLDPDEADSFEAEQERRQANGWDFFIVMYTKKDFKKFSLESDTFWKAILTTEEGDVAKAVEVETIQITPFHKVLYPHFNRWSRAYRVTFPKVALGGKFAVTLQSVVGESTLKWRISDVPSGEHRESYKFYRNRHR
ncbi:MAG: hypothetical protein V2A66_11165 [Pseudomonadota bacterium]